MWRTLLTTYFGNGNLLANNNNMQGIGKLYSNDLVKNLINVVGIAAFISVYSLVTVADFNVFQVDFVSLGKEVLNVSIIAVFVDLGRRFLTTKEGSLLGVTPEDK